MSVTLPNFRLEVYLARWEFAARHHLTASDAQTLSIAELLVVASDDQARGIRASAARLHADVGHANPARGDRVNL
jgi:hypothetical protein